MKRFKLLSKGTSPKQHPLKCADFLSTSTAYGTTINGIQKTQLSSHPVIYGVLKIQFKFNLLKCNDTPTRDKKESIVDSITADQLAEKNRTRFVQIVGIPHRITVQRHFSNRVFLSYLIVFQYLLKKR